LKPYLFLVPVLLGLVLFTSMIHAATSPASSGVLLMNKLSTSATPIGGGCYFPIQISMNLTWTGDPARLYRIQTNNFWLLITTPNIVVTNSSASSYTNPNNLVKGFNLFPNIPVNLILGFQPTCLPSVGVARLVYLDNTYNFTFNLP